jgi:phosphoglycerol transferase MdoB-like AlkP superfamily enzyme
MKEHGYHVSFLYGGFGMFDSMNAFFGSNGFELSDRTDITNSKFSNIWGVCDEDLFNHAIDYFDHISSTNKPFFSLIMTTSNHKPFTFPAGVPGVPPEGGGRKAGVKYADYAIGKFFERAKTRPWFGNTLFVVIADHDSRVYGRANVPVEHYRIPALLYAPGKLPAGSTQKYFSNMDLAPTVLGLLGLEYKAPFYGVDVLDDRVPAVRPVLLNHNHDVAIYKDGELSVLGLNRYEATFDYKDGQTTEKSKNSEMIELLTAYLQSAYELFKAHKY